MSDADDDSCLRIPPPPRHDAFGGEIWLDQVWSSLTPLHLPPPRLGPLQEAALIGSLGLLIGLGVGDLVVRLAGG
ncbi:hypothetical protein M0638_26035 [Roseomonas sp. NAR14]|uniref:Uncharacterized protein n=1 Tax=Roseomonas acroporae TaxID=2937791 RepID=A0A9X1YCV9_9PROT|nr:hypothetical protein [Roseomonas acroporae]MCK8787821.1 hypothetical protein [Roseomonas acroporae]